MQAQGNRSEGSDVTHTVKVIAGGRLIGGPGPEAGYTVAEEAPIFLLVFAVPAAVALLLVWKFSQR
jgi:hypothetical protein